MASFLKSFPSKKATIWSAIFLAIAVIELPLTIYLVQKPQNTQQQAAGDLLLKCDIDQNRTVNNKDYTSLLNCIQNKPSCTAVEKILSDMNKDGKIDEEDINIFLRDCKPLLKK